jgi:hypothetical protein
MTQAAQQQGGAPNNQNRRPYQGETMAGADDVGAMMDSEEAAEQRPAGFGDQPEAREIPIAAAPPEG